MLVRGVNSGSVFELDDDMARSLIAEGVAEEFKPKPPRKSSKSDED